MEVDRLDFEHYYYNVIGDLKLQVSPFKRHACSTKGTSLRMSGNFVANAL